MVKNNNDVFVVVRSANERTTILAKKLLLDLFESGNVVTINVVPFTEAIKESFRLGVQSGCSWLLCIDADVLVSKDGLKQMLNYRHSQHDNVFEIQGLILDKFLPIYRPAGNHLFRTKHCQHAFQHINDTIRPESDMLNSMALRGFPWVQCEYLVGIHDYEQDYSDILAKNFLQGIKHRNFVQEIIPYWRNSISDADYELAILGAEAGMSYRSEVSVNKLQIQEIAENLVDMSKWTPKPSLEFFDVHEVLSTYEKNKPATLSKYQDKYFSRNMWNRVIDKKSLTVRQRKSLIRRAMAKVKREILSIRG